MESMNRPAALQATPTEQSKLAEAIAENH